MMQQPARHELRPADAGYPESLRQLSDPPAVLYCMGDLSLLRSGLAVIGARRATPYGLALAGRFAGWAASEGVVIISGAAIGCDQAAQRAALAAGGRSVGVLGCGADVDYPSGAHDLLALLRQQHLVVSECPWGSPPTRWTFVKRNRIIAALSAALLVVEAGLGSGTFSTADYALTLGRDVLAVPGSILSPESTGSNRLIRQGAFVITEIDDLHACLSTAGLLGGAAPGPQAVERARTAIERALAASPMRPDDLARSLDLDVVFVVRRLAELELVGHVQRNRDGRFFFVRPQAAEARYNAHVNTREL
ncbi:MAG: DNA-processing protein DprA [Coriobacteriia bacterium]